MCPCAVARAPLVFPHLRGSSRLGSRRMQIPPFRNKGSRSARLFISARLRQHFTEKSPRDPSHARTHERPPNVISRKRATGLRACTQWKGSARTHAQAGRQADRSGERGRILIISVCQFDSQTRGSAERCAVWDRRLPGADAALSIRRGRMQARSWR